MKSKRELLAAVCLAMTLAAVAQGQPGGLIITDNPQIPGDFIDISIKGGVKLDFRDDDDTALIKPIMEGSNDVYKFENVWVGNNGAIGFGPGLPGLALPGNNDPIPSMNAFGGRTTAMALWDDIDDKEGDVFWDEIRGIGFGILIVQWNMRNFDDDPKLIATFQIQIFQDKEFQGIPVYAQFFYEDIEKIGDHSFGGSATIGHQDGPGNFRDFQWSFNDESVFNGTKLSVIPEPTTAALLVFGGLLFYRRR